MRGCILFLPAALDRPWLCVHNETCMISPYRVWHRTYTASSYSVGY
jgi:hypothetical protein